MKETMVSEYVNSFIVLSIFSVSLFLLLPCSLCYLLLSYTFTLLHILLPFFPLNLTHQEMERSKVLKVVQKKSKEYLKGGN